MCTLGALPHKDGKQIPRRGGLKTPTSVWNEENITAFWAAEPTPDPNEYVALVKQTYDSVKAADPDSTVLMGGVAGLDPAYLDNCFKAGIADYIDVVAYHP